MVSHGQPVARDGRIGIAAVEADAAAVVIAVAVATMAEADAVAAVTGATKNGVTSGSQP